MTAPGATRGGSNFNPRAPYGARPEYTPPENWLSPNFNPRAPYGARPPRGAKTGTQGLFQSSRPLRGATRTSACRWSAWKNFNRRAPYGARRWPAVLRALRDAISILAPLAGRDSASVVQPSEVQLFQSSRPLRGATLRGQAAPAAIDLFQSSRPLRGATSYAAFIDAIEPYFNPRAPCGARRLVVCPNCRQKTFQSSRPLRGATSSAARRTAYRPLNFNPRAPCGARRRDGRPVGVRHLFQSSRPLRGATHLILRFLMLFLKFQSSRPLRGATTGTATVTVS